MLKQGKREIGREAQDGLRHLEEKPGHLPGRSAAQTRHRQKNTVKDLQLLPFRSVALALGEASLGTRSCMGSPKFSDGYDGPPACPVPEPRCPHGNKGARPCAGTARWPAQDRWQPPRGQTLTQALRASSVLGADQSTSRQSGETPGDSCVLDASRAGDCVDTWAGPRAGLPRTVRAGSWEPPGAAGRAGHVGTHMGPSTCCSHRNIPTLVRFS